MSNQQQSIKAPAVAAASAQTSAPSQAPEPWTYERCMGREIEAAEFEAGVIPPGIADRVTSFNLKREGHAKFEFAAGPVGLCARQVKRSTEEVDGFLVTTLTDSARCVPWANVREVMFRDVVTVSREPVAKKADAA